MRHYNFVSILLVLISFPAFNGSETEDSATTSTSKPTTTKMSTEVYDQQEPYCFEFTWLGSNYDNTTEFTKNCEEFLEGQRVTAFIPCRQPLVITNDSTVPDLDYLWENYKTRVVRRRRKGEVCAKYSFKFNNEVSNITYMRAKIFAVNEGPVTSGCYTQIHSGTESELCVCDPTRGDYKPCNAANVNGRMESISNAAIGSLLCVFTWMLI